MLEQPDVFRLECAAGLWHRTTAMADLVGDYYRQHHQANDRYDFSIESADRAGWFGERVSSERVRAKRVLDLLDIGCRDGTLTAQYAEGQSVVGLDVDSDAIARARDKRGIDARKHDLNSEPLTFATGTFDVVVAGEILEHLQFPDVVVEEIRRVLKPGGVFLGSVPNAFRLRNRLQFLMGRDFEIDPTHLHHFSPESLTKLLSRFQDVRLDFRGGRRRNLHPRLMATQMYFSARAP